MWPTIVGREDHVLPGDRPVVAGGLSDNPNGAYWLRPHETVTVAAQPTAPFGPAGPLHLRLAGNPRQL